MAIQNTTEAVVGEYPAVLALPMRLPETRDSTALPAYFRWKFILDRGLAAAMLLPCLAVIALLVLVVRLTSRGPGTYRQKRVGKDGRVFTLYKLRTMRIDAEAATGAVWSEEHDPRVTPVGRVLRRWHLDEFPQVLNVLKGDMSLVGPRPERPEFVTTLKEKIPRYDQRLAVRPGVTGLAQLNLPPDRDLNDVRKKLVLDLEYLERAGLLLDVRILLGTCARMLKLPALGTLGLKRRVSKLAVSEYASRKRTRNARTRRPLPAARRKPLPR